MVIKYKIRGTDWLTFPLIIVNFNHFFIQPAPDKRYLASFMRDVPAPLVHINAQHYENNNTERYGLRS